jgi:pimeloyl-ACP methyl ester carboxylesterase
MPASVPATTTAPALAKASHVALDRTEPLDELAARFRMIAYDRRGHGASDKPADKENYAQV